MHHCIQGWSGIAAVGRPPAFEACRAGPAGARCPVRRVPLLRRGPPQRRVLRLPQPDQRAPSAEPARLRAERRAAGAALRRPRCGSGSRTSSATRWSSGSGRSNSSPASSRSARATAARTRMTNITTSSPIFELAPREPTCLCRLDLAQGRLACVEAVRTTGRSPTRLRWLPARPVGVESERERNETLARRVHDVVVSRG